MVELWGDIGFLLFTFSTLVFTIFYFTMSSAWRKNFIGGIIAIFSVSVTIVCTYLSLRIWNVALPGVDWLRLILFWVLGLTMLTAIVGFLQIQFGRRGKNMRRRLSNRYDDVTSSDKERS